MPVNSRKILILALLAGAFWSSACRPVSAKLADVCSEPVGTTVAVEGYIRLPEMMETIQQMSDGRITAVGHQPLLVATDDPTREAVKLTIWTTKAAEPNRMNAVEITPGRNELLVYSADGRQLNANNILRVTGEVSPDSSAGCALNVNKIEQPQF